MDVQEKVELVNRPPTEEVVTSDELRELFQRDAHPKHYIGLELSGFLHLGSLITTGLKINDFIKAGVRCIVFLADWHTLINDKLGGDTERISRVSKYYADAFRTVCPGVKIVRGSELYKERQEYWSELVRFAKHVSLARTIRTLTVMGRSEGEERVDLAKLLYPPMQAVDIHFLDVDLAHAGMDQRKIHMLVREVFPKMGWKVPVAIHHRLLPGMISRYGSRDGTKMSKSDPRSGILVHDTDDEIRTKVRRAWCEQGVTEGNPVLAVCQDIIFQWFGEMTVERPMKFGGNVAFSAYAELESEFAAGRIHPMDLKSAVSQYLEKVLKPLRSKLTPSPELRGAIAGL